MVAANQDQITKYDEQHNVQMLESSSEQQNIETDMNADQAVPILATAESNGNRYGTSMVI